MNRQISQQTLRLSSSNVLESCMCNALDSVGTLSKMHVFQLVDRDVRSFLFYLVYSLLQLTHSHIYSFS